MNAFLQRHAPSVIGCLAGWDRLRLRGTLRMLANLPGLTRFLRFGGVLLKEFGDYALESSRRVRGESVAVAEKAGRPVVHLDRPSVCKEDLARQIQERDNIKQGLICVLTAVELCQGYNLRSRPAGNVRCLELVHAPRKCQHLYHYYIHPVFGFMHVRLQTWLPWNLSVCVNGREWLARQMDAKGIGYVRKDNCFTRISDVRAAQQLMDEQTSFDWQRAMADLIPLVNPASRPILGNADVDYYWSIDESEWATDVMFRSTDELARLHPALVRHAFHTFGSRDALKFLGRRVPAAGPAHPLFDGEVVTTCNRRVEGVCVKHRVNRNSVKQYDKQGSVLRVETTLNNMRDFKAPRPGKDGKVVWRKMRKGVSDIRRRADVSDAVNARYLEQLAAVETPTPLKTLAEQVSRPTAWNGKRSRGLNLLGADDADLLACVGRGEFLISGFRNKDLHQTLYKTTPKDPADRRRRSGQVTRKLRLLRAHGLIAKVPKSHRYQVTEKGRTLIAAVLTAREADVEKLQKAA